MLIKSRGIEVEIDLGQSIFVASKDADGTDESSHFLSWDQVPAFDREAATAFVQMMDSVLEMFVKQIVPCICKEHEVEKSMVMQAPA